MGHAEPAQKKLIPRERMPKFLASSTGTVTNTHTTKLKLHRLFVLLSTSHISTDSSVVRLFWHTFSLHLYMHDRNGLNWTFKT